MPPSSKPYRIIAVCTGNICRSPMAERMLADAFAAAGLSGVVAVDSAGTTAYESGRPVDPRAARILAARSIDSSGHRARKWQQEWFSERHLILALDVDHYGWLLEAAPDEESRARVRMLRSFDPVVADGDNLDHGIEDPWYGGQSDFEETWRLIQASIPGIVEHVRAQLQLQEYQDPPEQQVRSIP